MCYSDFTTAKAFYKHKTMSPKITVIMVSCGFLQVCSLVSNKTNKRGHAHEVPLDEKG